MKTSNSKEHWQVKVKGYYVQWWPSSGKAVLDSDWNGSRDDVHGLDQLIFLLDNLIK